MAQTLTYTAPWPVFALDWCNSPGSQPTAPSPNIYQPRTPLPYCPTASFRLALGSFIDDFSNQLQIIGLSSPSPLNDADAPPSGLDGGDFNVLANAHHGYPATKVSWEPSSISSHSPLKRSNCELIASTSDVLKIWEFNPHQLQQNQQNPNFIHHSNVNNTQGSLNLLSQLTPQKTPGTAAPLTSFSWNETQPSRIVTSSVDTTCTVWDLDTRTAITQLIAHDREVYDVSWLPRSSDIFVSVGADGSLRAFDLRSLDHSTILYETTPPQYTANDKKKLNAPLLRIAFNPIDSNYLATFKHDSGEINILDMRSPGAPVTNIRAHDASVSSIGWKPDGTLLASGSDDKTIQIWDINNTPKLQRTTSSSSSSTKPAVLSDSIMSHKSKLEIHSMTWASYSAFSNQNQYQSRTPTSLYPGQYGQNLNGQKKFDDWLATASGYQVKVLKL